MTSSNPHRAFPFLSFFFPPPLKRCVYFFSPYSVLLPFRSVLPCPPLFSVPLTKRSAPLFIGFLQIDTTISLFFPPPPPFDEYLTTYRGPLPPTQAWLAESAALFCCVLSRSFSQIPPVRRCCLIGNPFFMLEECTHAFVSLMIPRIFVPAGNPPPFSPTQTHDPMQICPTESSSPIPRRNPTTALAFPDSAVFCPPSASVNPRFRSLCPCSRFFELFLFFAKSHR